LIEVTGGFPQGYEAATSLTVWGSTVSPLTWATGGFRAGFAA